MYTQLTIKSAIGWRVGVCDVPLHIHIKETKNRKKIPDINVWTADTNERSLATRAGKQISWWIGGWVVEPEGLLS